MKKIFVFSFIASLFALVYSQDFIQKPTKQLELSFFGSRSCGECLEIKEMLLKPLEKKFPDKLKVNYYEMEDSIGFSTQLTLETFYNVQQSSPQELFFPDTVLLGYDIIMKHAESFILRYLDQPSKWTIRIENESADKSTYRQNLKQRFNEYSFISIVAAGIIDGINPCAIATMIFFISFLAIQKRRKGEILVIGMCFTATVFVTYLLMGIGAFQLLTSLKAYVLVSKVIRLLAVICAAGFSLISFIDALRFKKSGKTSDIINQLPKPVKIRIHNVISGNLSDSQLIVGSIVTGFLVTLLEAVCTGQVYIPTIILMTQQSGLRIIGWLYLVLYNFLFIIPLLIIMILAYFGLKWDKLAKATQSHLTLMKILFGIVLGFLAVFLAIAG